MSLKNESASSKTLQTDVQLAAQQKFADFFRGLKLYLDNPVDAWQPDAEKVWAEGSTRILDFGGSADKPVLVIPPLINRANILDLDAERSLVKFLAEHGFKALLVDWGEPGDAEKTFDSDAYIKRLEKFIAEQKLENLHIVGYCMGGLFSLKLAAKIKPKSLALLATPWDFAAREVKQFRTSAQIVEKFLDNFDLLPPEFVQSIFFHVDPWRVFNKYSSIHKASESKLRDFLLVENWVNNGVKMSIPLAREALCGWAIDNSPAKSQWLDVSKIDCPTYMACPSRDKIVPLTCSMPLFAELPNAEIAKFDCGHVGLITKKLIHDPLKNWLEKHI